MCHNTINTFKIHKKWRNRYILIEFAKKVIIINGEFFSKGKNYFESFLIMDTVLKQILEFLEQLSFFACREMWVSIDFQNDMPSKVYKYEWYKYEWYMEVLANLPSFLHTLKMFYVYLLGHTTHLSWRYLSTFHTFCSVILSMVILHSFPQLF